MFKNSEKLGRKQSAIDKLKQCNKLCYEQWRDSFFFFNHLGGGFINKDWNVRKCHKSYDKM